MIQTLAVATAPLLFGFTSDQLAPGPRATTPGLSYHASGTGLTYTFLLMLIPMALSGVVLLSAVRSYPRDVATALASNTKVHHHATADDLPYTASQQPWGKATPAATDQRL